MTSELSYARLEASLDAKIERYFDTLDTDSDVLKQLLADKRSENTRRAYERDVNNFDVAQPTLALDLPLKVRAWEAVGGKVWPSYNDLDS
jgi:hypothetical protein